jgi:SH3 domain protein
MKKLEIFWIIVLPLCFINQPSCAATAYVTDSFEITLRTGPTTENRIITMLSSGEALEVLETRDDWTHVRFLDSEREQKEGWVLSRYLVNRQPWEAQAERLSKENTSLKEKLAMMEKKWEDSSQQGDELQKKFQQTSEALKKVQADFDSLKDESTHFLKLREQYEAANAALQTAQSTVQELTKKNEILRSSQNIRWFLAGGVVFLSALLIGLIIGRREKKRRTGLTSWKR